MLQMYNTPPLCDPAYPLEVGSHPCRRWAFRPPRPSDSPVCLKATWADLGVVLDGLRRMTSAQLADVVREARALIESRKCEGARMTTVETRNDRYRVPAAALTAFVTRAA